MTTRTISSDALREAHLARERLQQEGEVPSGVLREEIDASWRRSLGHGLDCASGTEQALDTRIEPDVLLAGNRLLLDAATPELDYLQQRQGHDGVIILANADATILSVEGARERMQSKGLADIVQGACWSEASRGTNALGTALVEKRATQIDCGEHFLDRLSRFSCTSVPIEGPQGTLLGVLDMTREGPLSGPRESLSLLSLAVFQIEARLFAVSHPGQVVIAFHYRRQYLDSAWQGLLALGLDGKVLAVSGQACQLLGANRESLVGRRSEDLLGLRGDQLLARLYQGGVGSLQTPKGELFYKTLQAPLRSHAVPVSARAPRPAAGPDLDALAGNHPRYARALRMARQGLVNELPVLLLGETGSGKEVVARALHQASARSDKPFVAVNCAAIPEGLIESELFGYRDGAFTGSRRGGMVGRLQQAHGGTLFLDEIGDMPLALQARLLRVLQERKVAPLGAGEEQDIDVALICATHRDLKRLVEEKHFREDLYYRVNGISVKLPALREREDLAELAAGVLARLGAPKVKLSTELLALLREYHWPGNIRQLEMVLRTALAMREEGEEELGLEHLPDSTLDELSAGERPQSGSIRENELELIRQALERHQGNVSAAADALGISRATLYRKLKQLKVG
ncbi:sigma-54-dependent Fis family transcriptional regulator [Pseudomonas sp. ZM23]|uniref:Sigma-54-dependent Fis family transcriptional regulator n=1 Tax=Pseudomonas triclosanedens TaxID=2961893 RepID=A0ABY7A4Z4_9PSED|nr:sigma-54-dependent Fis family transcriptional regulator [Pseudomonas triclosanedens]MCP8465518.1 sigma-54-dependent Fis family transcriptional regulator [Pseudomonas triclosanedens]MCP8471013.1 sigma-54-dependent Fis family transcriptional regulator [Pseudomonas triclosanedens]MCP8476817.1 sigma-54-dependent Fis family transcriptional regulator [Pseudomonas triclosanedens]WAI52066.1 sigma-54-dependent Fis family transcriptional regulator [Pseudomonas triclosanedens]